MVTFQLNMSQLAAPINDKRDWRKIIACPDGLPEGAFGQVNPSSAPGMAIRLVEAKPPQGPS